jgi:2-methylcitrate dehydratase PrpD
LVGGGGLGVYSNDFTEQTLSDPERLRLSALVRCVADAESTELFPHQFPAVLTVRLADGSEIVERVMKNRGGSDRPMSRDELALKFRLNAGQVLSPDRVDRLVTAILALDSADSVDDVMELAGGGKRP